MINPIIFIRTRILYASLVLRLCARGTLRIAASPLSLRYFIYDAIKKLRAVAARTSTAHQSKTFYRGM